MSQRSESHFIALVEDAIRLVASDPKHDLPLGKRAEILSWMPSKNRVHLALLSVQKTLPIWELHLPRDDAVRHALHLVKDVETGKMACVEAEGFLGGLWKHCDDLMSSGRYAPDVLMVGYAAARVMSVGDSEVLSYTSGATDLEIDSYGHDSFFLAATAYAGGAPWEEASNASKRQEFWAWWLGAVVDAVVER